MTSNRLLSLLALVLLCGASLAVRAQQNLGYHTDNYAGIHNIDFQPADIVDGRYQVDINIVNGSLNVGNNYVGMNSKVLRNPDDFKDPLFKEHFLTERLNGEAKNVYLNTQLQLPSVAFTVGKSAFAFSANFHTLFNVEGVSEKIAYMSYRELKTPDLWLTPYDNKNFSVQAMGYVDYGVSYGREVFHKGRHFLKAAGTVKLLQGLYSEQMYSKNANFSFKNNDTMSVNNTDFSYGHSANFEKDANSLLGFKFEGLPSFGFDAGIVYEYRKKEDKYTYNIDGFDEQYRDRNKYIFKLGASIVNIGSIDFRRGAGSASFYANTGNIVVKDFSVKSVAQFDSVVNHYFHKKDDAGTIYHQALPTLINLTADYNIWKGLYANVTASIAPSRVAEVAKVNAFSNYSVTLRYEHKWFGVWVPFSSDVLNNQHVGLGARLGPVIFGVNDISPLFVDKTIYDLGLYAALRIPFYFGHKHDRDGDGISNEKDQCPDVPGPLANKGCPYSDRDKDGVADDKDECPDIAGLPALNGCPDRDGDGVPDKDDACPDVAGSKEMHGCPDTDGDGIADKDDACPTEKGPKALNGCPDRDGDGIADKDDACPDVKGTKELKGCPDRDGDGIADSEDACPDVKGTKEGKGCPDTDGDGVYDNVDKCPTVAGPASNQGCPVDAPKPVVVVPKAEPTIIDTDGDGIPDVKDKCPTVKGIAENDGCPDVDTDGDGVVDRLDGCPKTPGPVDNKGCPRLEVKEQEVLNTAFKNLEFGTGSATIVLSSYTSLGDLAALMVKKPAYRLLVEGHTDNVGNPAANLRLSERRAEAVRTYLVSKGIAASRITTLGSGDKKPLDSNKTPEGRAKNRRVELTLKSE